MQGSATLNIFTWYRLQSCRWLNLPQHIDSENALAWNKKHPYQKNRDWPISWRYYLSFGRLPICIVLSFRNTSKEKWISWPCPRFWVAAPSVLVHWHQANMDWLIHPSDFDLAVFNNFGTFSSVQIFRNSLWCCQNRVLKVCIAVNGLFPVWLELTFLRLFGAVPAAIGKFLKYDRKFKDRIIFFIIRTLQPFRLVPS